jgi:rubredoxin
MPRPPMICTRTYRDDHGVLQRCEGRMVFELIPGTWTCPWCGRMMPGLYPGLTTD